MLKIKNQRPTLPLGIDYELEDGTLLATKEWNGETYTDEITKTSYRPVQIHNEEEDTWETIGFKIHY